MRPSWAQLRSTLGLVGRILRSILAPEEGVRDVQVALSRTSSLRSRKRSRTHYLRVCRAFGHHILQTFFAIFRFQEGSHGVSKPLRCKHRCTRPQDERSRRLLDATWPNMTLIWHQHGPQKAPDCRGGGYAMLEVGRGGAEDGEEERRAWIKNKNPT